MRCPFAAVAVIPILELHLWWCHYVNSENLGNHQKTQISAVCNCDDITLFCVFVCFFFSPISSPLCFAFHLAHSASLARQPAFATCSVCLSSATVCLSPPSSQPFFMSSSVVCPCQICRRHFWVVQLLLLALCQICCYHDMPEGFLVLLIICV